MRALLPTLITCLLTLPASAKYSGGTGEPNDPYQIATAADLIALGEDPNDYDKHFILTADIDLDPNLPGRKVFDKAVIAPDANPAFDNYGYREHESKAFVGTFDAKGHTISHLTIRGANYVGLFGCTLNPAWVRNLGMVDVDVHGSGSSVGGLVGSNGWGNVEFRVEQGGSVTDCYSTGMVSGGEYVGGLVGCNNYYGGVTHCQSSAMVSGTEWVGGLVGENVNANITGSCSTGVVSGGEYVGGLIGVHQAEFGAVVTRSYSTGRVSGSSYVGGLIGGTGVWAREPMGVQGGDVTECYSTGAVSGTSFVGGLVGVNYPWGSNRITTSFWDTQTSGQTESAGGTGKTTAEMQTAKTFLDARWDFVGETKNGTADIWWILEGKDYPKLWWELIPGN